MVQFIRLRGDFWFGVRVLSQWSHCVAAACSARDKGEFDLHWFGTYSKAKSLAKRAYVPAYIDSRDDLEIYTLVMTILLQRDQSHMDILAQGHKIN
jgi:hypothetical protein